MARILILCSRIPYPLTGGAKLRMFHTAKQLAKEHKVELVAIDRNSINGDYRAILNDVVENLEVFSYSGYRFYSNAAAGILSTKPLQTHYFYFEEVNEWLNNNESRFDLIYSNHVRTAEYTRSRSVPKIIDFVDAISRNYKNSVTDASGIWNMIYPIEWRRLIKYERFVLEEFDNSIITTEEDKIFITSEESPRSNISVIPNGVKKEILENNKQSYNISGDPQISFLGKMDYSPNIDAVSYFVSEILPIIKREYPNVEFNIIGTQPDRKVQKLDREENVNVTGYVENPIDYLMSSDVFVAPMRHGAGLQNKVLEAMGLGLPVIASSLACEGIESTNGDDVIMADSSQEFAEAVSKTLQDPIYREKLGQNARALVRSVYTWDSIGEDLLDIVAKTI